jgi:hypothetical protein
MKIDKNLKVFSLRITGVNQIKLVNSNDELSKIIKRLFESTNGIIDLNFLLDLDFSKSNFEGIINNQKVRINLYQNQTQHSQVSMIEIEGDDVFSLEEINNSTLFIDSLELLVAIGIHDNIISKIKMDTFSNL